MRPERARALSCHGTRIVVELANDYAHTYAPFIQGGSKGSRSQLSTGREVAHAGAHPRATGRPMESPEREEPNGALPASDRQAHPPPLQEVSNASAPLSAPLNVAGNVRFVATSGHPARVFALLALARSRPHRQSP